MAPRRLMLLGFLCVLGFLAGRAGRHRASPAVSRDSLRRIMTGADGESDRRALARAVAEACEIRITDGLVDDPYLLRAELDPAGGVELALAARVAAGDGFLAVLSVEKNKWRVLNHLGPAVLGEPTSLSILILPGWEAAALVLTDLADQTAGAFCRRETCSILALRHGAFSRLWTKEIETHAYWNRAWDAPPGRGWLRLSGQSQWQAHVGGEDLTITVAYRNTLAEAAHAERLPEEGRFTIQLDQAGGEVYRWDPSLGLFVLGYGRTRVRTVLLGRAGGMMETRGPVLPAGEPVAVTADERSDPRALLGDPVYLQVYTAGRTGLLDPGALDLIPSRPADLPRY